MRIRPAIRNLEQVQHRPGVTVVRGESYKVSGNTLVTYNAATCVILAAHNALTRLGLLGHFSAVSGDWGVKLQGMSPNRYVGMDAFAEAIKEIPGLGPLDETDIAARGAVKEIDGVEYSDMWFERKFVIGAVGCAAAGYRSLSVKWSDTVNQLVDAKLDCPAGKLLIANHYTA